MTPRTLFATRPAALSVNTTPAISYVAAFRDLNILFQYSLNGDPWSDWLRTSAWPPRSLPDGHHVFRVRGLDDYSNLESPFDSLLFEIDATAPSPSILAPGPNATVRDSLMVRGAAMDARFSRYSLDYRSRSAMAWTPLVAGATTPVTDGVLGGWNTRTLADGPYELRLSVADTLGLVGTLVIPVSVDNHFPYAAQTSPALVTAAAGGDVYTDDGRAHLYLPPHGLGRDTIVTVAALDTVAVPAALPDGALRVSAGVQLDWGTVALEKTATLDLASAGSGTPVVYYEGADSTWRRLGGTVDAQGARVAVPVSAPGRYALYSVGRAISGAGGAALTMLTLTPRVFGPRGTYASSDVAIGFTLGRAGPATVRVFSLSGRMIREVAREQSMGPGANVVRWDGRDRDGRVVEDGLYLVRVEALGSQRNQTLAVVR